MNYEFEKYTQFAIATCAKAGDILCKYYGEWQNLQVSHKGKYDLVTQADKESEKYIVAEIEQHFPQHCIHGEEFTNKTTDSEYKWYIDPLDGTTNFVHGHPFFGISMG